jgi:hypothetical protein
LVIEEPLDFAFQLLNYTISKLLNASFYFFMRRMLAAAIAKFLQFQPLRHGLPILGGGIIPFFALTALQRNDFSRHN